MAGHSKWAKLKHFKGAIDAKRARIFAKLSRELMIAARLGGGNPDANPRLRMVLLKCRSANMPSENIERAIKKGTGEIEGETYEELTYEIFGPNSVAILVEASTDNRNRTTAEIRSLLTKHGGRMASAGAVSRFFKRQGQMLLPREAADEDKLIEWALEAGAEDVRTESAFYEILTDPSEFESVHKQLEGKGLKFASAEVTYVPVQTVPVTDASTAEAINSLVEALEEHDDVKEVHTNADFAEQLV
ncbi:MAG: YebC/PmpR family DNA-binding transcriptional regulator [Verrucomicrobiae bacterium]|nr:YebC/PmpR family DNA-binding transcriptional regulator [Verrucomicrobiae bacterium]